jgi:hypothetical protein
MATQNGTPAATGEPDLRKQVAAITAELNAAVEKFTADSNPDAPRVRDIEVAQRQSIMDAASKLIRTIKEPTDQFFEYSGLVGQMGALRLLWEWGVLDAIPLEGSISYAELATQTETEEALLGR